MLDTADLSLRYISRQIFVHSWAFRSAHFIASLHDCVSSVPEEAHAVELVLWRHCNYLGVHTAIRYVQDTDRTGRLAAAICC